MTGVAPSKAGHRGLAQLLLKTAAMKKLTSGSVAALPYCLLVVGIAACGDDGGPAGGSGAGGAPTAGSTASGGAPEGGAASAASAEAYCEDLAARDVECAVADPISNGECLSDELTVCLFGGQMRDAVRDAIVECVIERPCDAMGDLEECIYSPGEENPAPGQVEFRQACLAVQADCATFSDDHCITNFFEASGFEALSLCLEETCDAVGPCLEATTSELCAG